MKKILLALILILTVSLSTTLAATGDVNGFKGYKWGTDFETINKDKNLKYWLESPDNESEYISMNDTVNDENGDLIIGYSYLFYNNKLVSGRALLFSDATYTAAFEKVKQQCGNPVSKEGFYVFSHQGTYIFCHKESKTILFRDADHAKTISSNEKKEAYDKYFN